MLYLVSPAALGAVGGMILPVWRQYNGMPWLCSQVDLRLLTLSVNLRFFVL